VKIQFDAFVVDSDRRQLLREGQPLHLSRKAFDALCALVQRRPAAVTKEELHARLWPGTFVVDANLSVAVAEIRRALGDDPQAPRFIRTVHRVGYAFCAESTDLSPAPPEGRAHAVWFAWNGRVLPLGEGEHVIGRDPDCAIWLDAPGVSRRHARVRVDGREATLEDLGSKNGTRVGEVPVTAPRRLVHGELVHVGPECLEFRSQSGNRATETVRLTR
jgi:DNA-binding winged helix-turn-helix (wHTH) protein